MNAVSEEDIREDEILRKIKEIVKCPVIDKCKVPITRYWFELYCMKKDFFTCEHYDNIIGRKTAIEWAKSLNKNLLENVNTE